ncbi:hypothetical protein D3C76_1427150 [compost metagenome]
MWFTRNKVFIRIWLLHIYIIHIACNRRKSTLPLSQRPGISIVGVQRNNRAVFCFNRFQCIQEIIRCSRGSSHTCIFKHFFVIQNTGEVNRSWNTVYLSSYRSFLNSDVFLAQIGIFTKRLKKVCSIFNRNTCREQQNVTIIIGVHTN